MTREARDWEAEGKYGYRDARTTPSDPTTQAAAARHRTSRFHLQARMAEEEARCRAGEEEARSRAEGEEAHRTEGRVLVRLEQRKRTGWRRTGRRRRNTCGRIRASQPRVQKVCVYERENAHCV